MNRRSQVQRISHKPLSLALKTHHDLTANFHSHQRVSVQIHSTNFHWNPSPMLRVMFIKGCEGTIPGLKEFIIQRGDRKMILFQATALKGR